MEESITKTFYEANEDFRWCIMYQHFLELTDTEKQFIYDTVGREKYAYYMKELMPVLDTWDFAGALENEFNEGRFGFIEVILMANSM